ncbi:class I SAM-dependent methyltransferase [Cellulomonas humilata]|uniref:SAM-dependent methyltransferase n=1 Tax=Cellulomonas humilata TaxID=144055 RepID=A0ABU0EHA1_9CELL|nr:class I SAM-dependent methyltransferase [Cellulomonas humilata]MDQ0374597.1 SAM-dependent methyltransferase [Cellulomonas humilata]
MSRSDGAVDAGHPQHASGYDSELQRLDVVFRQACDVQTRDRVLDVGCGTGQSTRAAALAAHDGSALGVDSSAPAVERARGLADAAGLGNIAFERGDAQVHPFPGETFDLAISRFGTMFFHDAGAAFTNLARALRPAGRLVMLVWQAGDRNEWDVAIHRALAEGAQPIAPSRAFSLADPARTTEILEAAGFVDISFTDVEEPVYYGPDVVAAEAWVRSFTSTGELLERLDPDGAEQGLARLRETLSAHLRDDGVWFGSRAWIVSARRGEGVLRSWWTSGTAGAHP